MAVRSVMIRDNWIVHVKCILSKTLVYQKTNIKRLYCCRTPIHSRCLNERNFKHVVSVLVPLRHLVQDANEGRTGNESKEILLNQNSKTEAIEKEEEQITVDYYRGLPRITVPLPSRDEKCRFTLKPISNTVRDLSDMIREEDRGIDRVVVRTLDNVKIASSCSVALLLEEEEFFITINDKHYRVKVPPEIIKKSFTKDDIEKLADTRMLISQLYESLNVKEYHVYKERELVAEIEKIQSALKPLEEERTRLEKKAALRTSVLTWLVLGAMSMQCGALARLTWWEYSWDIMEPVTYFVTYGTVMATYAYYLITKQDYIYPDVRDRQFLITMHKKARKVGLDLNEYNRLKEKLYHAKEDLDKLRDPTISFRSTSKISAGNLGQTDCYSNDQTQSSLLNNVRNYITLLMNKVKKLLN